MARLNAANWPTGTEGVDQDMSVSVTMPALGESVTEGTVTRWLKQVGDTVAADEPLVEISTDKVDTEIPSPASGVLLAIRVGEDETIAVGAELAVIGEASESTGALFGEPADHVLREDGLTVPELGAARKFRAPFLQLPDT